MKKKEQPQVVKINNQELKKLKADLQESNLSAPHKKIVMAILEAYYWLFQMYQLKKLSLKKVARLFGFKTERNRPDKDSKEEKQGKEQDGQNRPSNKKKPKGPKNHGRNGEKDHPGAKRVTHKLEDLQKGDSCPLCPKGKLYPVAPGISVQFTGNPPIQTTVHEAEKLRCNACGAYFEAELSEELKKKCN